MAEEEKTPVVERSIGNIGVADWQVGLAAAVNETYNFANSYLFCAQIAGYYRDYAYRYILPCAQWMNGYVPTLHRSGETGIISTRIAAKLISGLTTQTVGEKLVLRLASKLDEKTKDDLKFASEWIIKNKVHKAVRNAIGFAYGFGTSLLKINRRLDGSLWWEAVRFDNAYYLADFTGEVQDAKFVMRNYTDTRDKKNIQYYLVEHRYWKTYKPELQVKDLNGIKTFEVKHKAGDRVAVVEYQVHRAESQSYKNLMSPKDRTSVNWDEIPYEIRKMIKNDYGTMRIGEPKILGFDNLGVVALLNNEGDLSIPTGTNFGESMIIGIQDDLITYEVASSYLLRDMYNGKGTVYIPRSMSMGDIVGKVGSLLPQGPTQAEIDAQNGTVRSDGSNMIRSPVNLESPFAPAVADNPLSGLDGNKFERIPGVNPEDQSAIVQQFEIRAQEWQTVKENALKNIAVKWGVSPKILSSFLAQGTAQMTATQIDSEDDITIAFINAHRADFREPINQLMEITMNAYGKPSNINIDFASPSLINKDRLLDRVTKELEAGLIDEEEAIRTMNPDLEEEKIQEKIDKFKERQQQLMMQQMYEMNPMGGGFGPEESLGGPGLKGSTEMDQ